MGDGSSGDEPPPQKAAGWAVFDSSFLVNPPASFAGLVYAIIGLVALAIIAAGCWILSQFVLQTLTTPPKDFEDIGRRLLAFGLIVAAPFAIWRIVVSHWQARAAQTQAAAAGRQADVAREEHYTSLFTAAVQQLGALREVQEGGSSRTEPNTEARLGAIYALERIAQDSERDHWPIMETLCAYVRSNAGPPVSISEEVRAHLNGSKRNYAMRGAAEAAARPPADVQAALTVIGRRSKKRCDYERQLRESAGDTSAYRLDLTRSNLAGVVLNGNFDHAQFDRSSLTFSRIRGVSLVSTSFFAAHGEGARVHRADLTEAQLMNSHWEGAYFEEATADKADAYGVNLEGATFKSSTLTAVELGAGELLGATFNRTDLTRASMVGADLAGAHFHLCSLQRVEFHGASIIPIRLTDCDCVGAEGFNQEELDVCFGNMATKLPDEVVRPAAWNQEAQGALQEWRQARARALSHRLEERNTPS